MDILAIVPNFAQVNLWVSVTMVATLPCTLCRNFYICIRLKLTGLSIAELQCTYAHMILWN